MKSKIISALKYLLFLSAGLFLLWLAFRSQDLNKIAENIRHANFWWIGLSLFISFFAFVARAYRWNMMIKPLGYKPSLKNSTASLMVGYFANLAIPRIGEVSRCAMLGRAEKIPVDVLFGTVIAERIIDLISLLFLMLLLAILQFHKIGGFLFAKFVYPLVEKFESNIPLLTGLSVIGLLLISITLFYFFRTPQDGKSSPLKFKIQGFINNIFLGLKTVIQMENKFKFLILTIFIWSIYLLVSYVCFFSLEATSGLGLMEGLYALVIGGVGMSMPVQGGIGTYHWMVSEGLTLYGVPQQDGLILATIVHASQTLFIIVWGALSYFMLILQKNRNAS